MLFEEEMFSASERDDSWALAMLLKDGRIYRSAGQR